MEVLPVQVRVLHTQSRVLPVHLRFLHVQYRVMHVHIMVPPATL